MANPLAMKLTMAVLTAGDEFARDYLRRQRSAHLSRMRDYTRAKTDPDASMSIVLAADYALEHLDADLRWLDTALARTAALYQEIRP